ncbi:MAG: hypothetical protein ACFE0Q_20755 [Anaerolineae bacterium]
MQKIIIALLTITSITLGTMLFTQRQQSPYAVLMLNCSGEFRTTGSHVSYHPTEADARATGDARLAEFDIAYIYQPASPNEFAPLLWVKTDTDCYNGQYRNWTRP